MRITHKDAEYMFASAVAYASDAGVDSSKWVLHRGESIYSLVEITGAQGHSTVVGFLGNTAKEAYTALSFIRQGFFLVIAEKEKK